MTGNFIIMKSFPPSFLSIFSPCRQDKLEESMKEEGLSEDQKQEKRQQHAQKETEFLRLKRSRLGVEDFEALKVIGRGAFGEVSSSVVYYCCF